jgi:hypothetical protein
MRVRLKCALSLPAAQHANAAELGVEVPRTSSAALYTPQLRHYSNVCAVTNTRLTVIRKSGSVLLSTHSLMSLITSSMVSEPIGSKGNCEDICSVQYLERITPKDPCLYTPVCIRLAFVRFTPY